MSKKKQAPLCLGLMALLLFPAMASAEVVDKVVATVNQQVITLYELQRAMDNIGKEALKNTPKGKKEEIPDLKKAALEHLIDETLINQEMEKLSVSITDADVSQAIKNVLERNNLSQAALQKELSAKGTSFESYREDIRSQLKRYKFIQQVMGSKVRVNEEDVEAFYAQNASKLGDVQSVKIAQIVVPLSAGASDDELKKAQGRASEIYQKAKGGGNFDSLMKQYGGEGSGDLGTVSYSSLSPQLANEIGRLDKGQVTEPVRTSAGFLIVKLLDKPEAGLQGSDQIKGRIRDRIYEIKLQEEMQKYVDQLKGKAFIDIKS